MHVLIRENVILKQVPLGQGILLRGQTYFNCLCVVGHMRFVLSVRGRVATSLVFSGDMDLQDEH